MNIPFYPIKFTPILKEKIWGGEKLKTVLYKTSNLSGIGESWELSDIEGDTSVVSNGPLKGQSLKDLLKTSSKNILGKKNYRVFGNKFPLLIKFIDAKKDLSIQLHPNDELASKRHNAYGKTEMWYVLQADEGSNLIVGFNQPLTPEKYSNHLKSKTLSHTLNFEKVENGDAYFIEAGRVHAIGGGVLLAEIQQTSDITYRIYDWDRVDSDGNKRELHSDLALDAINFDMPDNFRVNYSREENKSNKMISCPYFNTNFLKVSKSLHKTNDKDSFLIYICVDGTAEITSNGFTETVKKGETVLLPACIKNYEITSKEAKLLEVYL